MHEQGLAFQSDENLVCREFLNTGKVRVIFESTLELRTHFVERPSQRIKYCEPGHRTVLTHAYYTVSTADGSSIEGKWFFGPNISSEGRARLSRFSVHRQGSAPQLGSPIR